MNPTQTFEVDTDELDGLNVNEEVAELDTVFVNLEKAKQAQVALESMVTILESQVLKSNSVSFANFTLETIANQVGLSAEDLKVSLEENGDENTPGEQQPSVLQKAKGFLSSIKNTVSLLVAKMLLSTQAFLGNVGAMATKLLNNAQQLKQQANKATETKEVSIKKAAAKYLTVDGEVLSPDQYVKTLQSSTKILTGLVDKYGGLQVIENFVASVEQSMSTSGKGTQPVGTLKFVDVFRSLAKNKLTDPNVKYNKQFEEVYATNKLLGGVCLVAVVPKSEVIEKSVQYVDATVAKSKTVSQELFSLSPKKESGGARIIDEDDDEYTANQHMERMFLANRLAGYMMIAGGVGMFMKSAAAGAILGPWGMVAVALAGIAASVAGDAKVKNTSVLQHDYRKTTNYSMESGETEVIGNKKDMLNAMTRLSVQTFPAKQVSDKYNSLNAQQIDKVCDTVIVAAQEIIKYAKTIKDRQALAKRFDTATRNIVAQSAKSKYKALVSKALNYSQNTLKQITQLEINMLKELAIICKAGLLYAKESM